MSKFGSIAATCIAVAFGFVAGASRADLWVAPSPMGSDNNNGSQGAPFRSIQKAVDTAPTEGCVIHLAEGSYIVETGKTPDQMLLVNKPVSMASCGPVTGTFSAIRVSGALSPTWAATRIRRTV